MKKLITEEHVEENVLGILKNLDWKTQTPKTEVFTPKTEVFINKLLLV